MTEPELVRVFVNGTGISIRRDAMVLDAVRAVDADAADAVASGLRRVTDSRGLPVEPDSPLAGGTVLRLVSVRPAPGESE